jgi:hypothetical protein
VRRIRRDFEETKEDIVNHQAEPGAADPARHIRSGDVSLAEAGRAAGLPGCWAGLPGYYANIDDA